MELMKNLRWMCRVCAVNIRKRRSSSSAVPIFDTPELLQKLKKYLHMDVEYDDKLPKSICSNCFKRLESVYNFAVLAKKTENFLKDFISIAENNVKNTSTSQISARFQSEFASFALLSAEKQIVICDEQVLNESDDFTMLEMEDSTYQEMAERAYLAAQQTLSSGSLRFIPVKSKNTSLSSSPERLIATGPPIQKNSLDQKRRNLKMILANNNAQVAQSAPKHNATPLPQPTQLPPAGMISPTSEHAQNNEPLMYDCLNLGCVIKDMDLLKLILKALKWPFTQDTLSAQIHRLKNTRFRDVMVDPNLLQDTDLMQILSSYLSPILLHSQNSNINSAPVSVNSNVNPNVNSVLPNTLHTYKIPADTSVHLVSVPLESPEKRPRVLPTNKPRGRRTYKPRVIKNESPIEILSDDDTRDVQNFEVNIDPALYFPQSSAESQENSTESLVMSLVGKSRPSLDTNAAKVRKKQRRKEAHVKLHTDNKPEEDLIIINDSEHDNIDNCDIKRPSERKQQEENIFFNADTLGAQFPLVAIIDDNSNDDAVWAEFKVVESPLHDESGENISNRSFVESSFTERDDNLKKSIKQEVVDTSEDKQIKIEPVDQDLLVQIQEPQAEVITPDEARGSFEDEPLNIKEEPIDKEEHMEKQEHIKKEEKLPDIQNIQENVNEEGDDSKPPVLEKQIYLEESEKSIEYIEHQVVIEEEDEEPVNELTESDAEHKRKDCQRNKEKVDSRFRESTLIKETGRITRSASRVQSLANGKRIPRSTRRLSYSPAKKKDSRFSRPCKRMCKQCGYIFRKPSDLIKHRKVHR